MKGKIDNSLWGKLFPVLLVKDVKAILSCGYELYKKFNDAILMLNVLGQLNHTWERKLSMVWSL